MSMPLLVGGAATSPSAYGDQDRARLLRPRRQRARRFPRARASSPASSIRRAGRVRAGDRRAPRGPPQRRSSRRPSPPAARHRRGEAQGLQARLRELRSARARREGRRRAQAGARRTRSLIDWRFFFYEWGMKQPYPAILDDPELGPEARKLKAEAEAMLARMGAEGRVKRGGALRDPARAPRSGTTSSSTPTSPGARRSRAFPSCASSG